MLMFHRPDNNDHRRRKRASSGVRHFLPRLLLLLPLLFGFTEVQAQGAKAQRAIEKLEGCSKEEAKRGCISILKRRDAGNGKQAIKAQVRGGRIIWYEYDPGKGRARRTN